ncbi:MAG: hypothetical protein ABI207_02205 [Crocinitomicaceae bacterium]
MTEEQKEKLSFVFNSLTKEQRKRDLLHLPFKEFESKLHNKEAIAVEVSDTIRNRSMFKGYSGVITLLRVSKDEVILKPNLIEELITEQL